MSRPSQGTSMSKLPADICQHYASSRGSHCPVCSQPTKPGRETWYVSPYDQVFVGYADPRWPHGNDVAVVFECQSCFDKYWFHWSLDAAVTFEEDQREWAANQ